VTFEVLRSIFEYASERMSTVLKRASFSPILADMVDFSNAIYDYECAAVVAGRQLPDASGGHEVQRRGHHRAAFRLQTMQPGDIYVLNDPYKGGTHINDITFLIADFLQRRQSSPLPSAVDTGWISVAARPAARPSAARTSPAKACVCRP
jgi:N-methylhydantoinase B